MKKLGSGAFAQVWQCKDLKETKQVAVKVLKSDSVVRDTGEEEVEILRSLKKSGKEHLLEILDDFVEDGPNGKHICIVTELLGPCLLDCLPPVGMCLHNVKQVMHQVLAGLEYLHTQAKIIHTDIKPENVLLSNNCGAIGLENEVDGIRVKLADLGCALRVGETYPAIVGTSEYRAPELLLEAPYDVEIDIWATACLAFELATGKYLFKPDSSGRVLKEEMHLALMTKVLGPVPQSMVESGRAGRSCYNRRTGQLHHFPLHSLQAEDLPTLIGERRGGAKTEDGAFSKFLLPMLEMRPEQRATACKALEHPFLTGGGPTKAAKFVQKVRLSFVEESVHSVQDLRKPIAEFPAADQFLQKVGKRRSLEAVEEPEFGKVGYKARAENLITEKPVQIVEDLMPGGEMSARAFGAAKKLKIRLSIEKPLDTVRDCGMMTQLSGTADRRREKPKRRKRLSEVMEASKDEESSIVQYKKTRRGEEEQGSEDQAAVCSREKSPKTKRKASKVARLNLKKAASQSMAQGLTGLNKQSASNNVLQVRAQKFDPRGQPGLPLMDEILAATLGRVAVKSLVTGKALVDHVAKNYPEFGSKEVWMGKLKAALDMEVARGNLLLVTIFKHICAIRYNIIF